MIVDVNEVVAWDKTEPVTDKPINTLTVRNYGNAKYLNKGKGINRNIGEVANYNSSVCMAINIALNRGFDTLFLFGVDQKIINGVYNVFGQKMNKCDAEEMFRLFDRFYREMKADLRENEKIYTVGESAAPFANITFEEYQKMTL